MKRLIKDEKEFSKLIDEFIQYTEDNKELPDDYNLCKFLGISPVTLYDYRENKENRYNGYADVYKKIVLYREHFFTSAMYKDSKQTAAAIFQLKQQKNGGFADKQEIETGPISITINGSDKIGQ